MFDLKRLMYYSGYFKIAIMKSYLRMVITVFLILQAVNNLFNLYGFL